MKLTICKLRASATVPSYAHEGDACFDLYAAEPTLSLAAGALELDRLLEQTGGMGTNDVRKALGMAA